MEELISWLEANADMLGAITAIASIIGVFTVGGYRSLQAVRRRMAIKDTAPGQPAQDVPKDRPSVAVLPLNAMASDPEIEHVADGITEDVITLLARVPGFVVAARNSTFTYKGANHDIRKVGRELGVRYVVEGSLRQIGEKLRINIQLIEAASGTHVWAGNRDLNKQKTMEDHDIITSVIVASLQPQIMREEAQRAKQKPVDNLEVWELIHRAFSPLLLGFRHGVGTEESVALARKAMTKDPNNARAKAVLAWSLANVAIEKPDSSTCPEMIEALEVGQEAVRLDRRDTMVLYCWGTVLVYATRIEEAIRYFDQALAINPNDAQTLAMLGSAYSRINQIERGNELVRQAMQLSPDDPRLYLWHGYLAVANIAKNDFEAAIEEARRAVQHHPGFFIGWVVIAASNAALERDQEALSALDEILKLAPNFNAVQQARAFDQPGNLSYSLREQFLPLVKLVKRERPSLLVSDD